MHGHTAEEGGYDATGRTSHSEKTSSKREGGNRPGRPTTLDDAWLRQVCLEAGADDVGFVEIGRAEIADQKQDILWALPKTKTLELKL